MQYTAEAVVAGGEDPDSYIRRQVRTNSTPLDDAPPLLDRFTELVHMNILKTLRVMYGALRL